MLEIRSRSARRVVRLLQSQSRTRARTGVHEPRPAEAFAELGFGAQPVDALASLGPAFILPDLVSALAYPRHKIGVDHDNLLLLAQPLAA